MRNIEDVHAIKKAYEMVAKYRLAIKGVMTYALDIDPDLVKAAIENLEESTWEEFAAEGLETCGVKP